MMLISRNSPAKRITRIVGLLIGQRSFPWRTQKASKLELASLVELGTVAFTGRELPVGETTPVPDHHSLRLCCEQSGPQDKACQTKLKGGVFICK